MSVPWVDEPYRPWKPKPAIPELQPRKPIITIITISTIITIIAIDTITNTIIIAAKECREINRSLACFKVSQIYGSLSTGSLDMDNII